MTSPGTPTPLRSRSLTWLWALLAAAGTLAAGLAVAARHRPPAPPVLATLPDFHLLERSGRALDKADLAGRAWVADFIFTRCSGICPAMSARMARFRREVPHEVPFVSFTVDPRHDTAEALSQYARGLGAGENWLFATGEQAALHRLATEGFKLAAMEVPPGQEPSGDGPFLHSSKFVLVDGQARVRGYYDSRDEEALAALRRDLEALGFGG